jgi:DNA-binding beta-propeller fold protein YncE
MRRRALLAAALVATLPASAAAQPDARDVVFVANAEAGTVSLVDAVTFDVLAELDVLPDGPDARVDEDDPVQALLGQQVVEAAGGINWVQDQDVSPDGRTLYVSRGHRGDVAAFDLATGEQRWKTAITGVRADHMTISPDGSRLYVSALTTDLLEVLDASTGAVLERVRTGEWPHDNHLSADATRLYNASIGSIITPFEVREARAATPATPYVVTVYDRETLEVLDTHNFAAGVRPFVVTDDDRLLYAQRSEHHGVIAYDLVEGAIVRSLDLPIAEGVTEADYDFEAPHHGLAMTADEATLCIAGRASDYVALVDTATLSATAIVDVGDAPSWAEITDDGRHCVVANNRDGTISFVALDDPAEVARVAVGDGPKHLDMARVPGDVLAAMGAVGADAAAGGTSPDGEAGEPGAADEAADPGAPQPPEPVRTLPATGSAGWLAGLAAAALSMVGLRARRAAR